MSRPRIPYLFFIVRIWKDGVEVRIIRWHKMWIWGKPSKPRSGAGAG